MPTMSEEETAQNERHGTIRSCEEAGGGGECNGSDIDESLEGREGVLLTFNCVF